MALLGSSCIMVQKYQCKICGSYFSSPIFGKERYNTDVVREAVELYYDTRGSYRRVMKALRRRGVKVSHVQIYRWIDKLGASCKSTVDVARELCPKWSSFLGLDSKVVKVGGRELILLVAVDLGTQDLVHSNLVEHEDYDTLSFFLFDLKRKIGYEPKMVVIDLDPAWIKAVREIFPDVPLQGCVVHMERIVDRAMPKRKRTKAQEELKDLIRQVLYAKTLKDSRKAFHELLDRRDEWRDASSKSAISTILGNYPIITAHFRVKGSYRDNNITESAIDKIETKLKIVRGFKKESTAVHSLRLAIMHYRFNPFLSSKSGNNGKSPLMLAGVDTSKIDWVLYSQVTQM